MRNSNEPETSNERVRDLSEFLRECRAFVEDHGYRTDEAVDYRILELRNRFEELMGGGDTNMNANANGGDANMNGEKNSNVCLNTNQ